MCKKIFLLTIFFLFFDIRASEIDEKKRATIYQHYIGNLFCYTLWAQCADNIKTIAELDTHLTKLEKQQYNYQSWYKVSDPPNWYRYLRIAKEEVEPLLDREEHSEMRDPYNSLYGFAEIVHKKACLTHRVWRTIQKIEEQKKSECDRLISDAKERKWSLGITTNRLKHYYDNVSDFWLWRHPETMKELSEQIAAGSQEPQHDLSSYDHDFFVLQSNLQRDVIANNEEFLKKKVEKGEIKVTDETLNEQLLWLKKRSVRQDQAVDEQTLNAYFPLHPPHDRFPEEDENNCYRQLAEKYDIGKLDYDGSFQKLPPKEDLSLADNLFIKSTIEQHNGLSNGVSMLQRNIRSNYGYTQRYMRDIIEKEPLCREKVDRLDALNGGYRDQERMNRELLRQKQESVRMVPWYIGGMSAALLTGTIFLYKTTK
jgi:hypothetical protein